MTKLFAISAWSSNNFRNFVKKQLCKSTLHEYLVFANFANRSTAEYYISFVHCNTTMLRPISIIVLVALAELQFGDGVGQGQRSRYGSFPARSRFSTAPVSAPEPAPEPAPAPMRPPPQRTSSPTRSSRFDSSRIPQQSSFPGMTQSRSFNANAPTSSPPTSPAPSSQRPRIGNKSGAVQSQPSRTQSASGSDAAQIFPPGFFQSLGSGGSGIDDLNWGPLVPNVRPGVMMIEVGPDGQPLHQLPPGYQLRPNSSGPVSIQDYLANERRREEEEDPDSHKINTEGEIIEQKLPSGGGDIVIKISGTNITQRKMNKIREYLKKSIDFVFENTQSRTPMKARYM